MRKAGTHSKARSRSKPYLETGTGAAELRKKTQQQTQRAREPSFDTSDSLGGEELPPQVGIVAEAGDRVAGAHGFAGDHVLNVVVGVQPILDPGFDAACRW